MAAALPGNIQLKLEQTLAQWRQWDCDPPLSTAPKVIERLTPGLSNFSILVAAERRFVVRVDGINPTAHGLSRQGEWHSLKAAHRAGLAPQPRYFNPELGSLVCDYLEPDAEQPRDIGAVAALLRGIHSLPPRHQRLDLAERIRSYEKRLAQHHPARGAQLAPFSPAVAQLLARIQPAEQPPVLCHHDLLCANRLYSDGRLFALDWEYSAMGCRWYDLAVVVAGDELDAATTEALLEAYLGRPATSDEQILVAHYACVYRYLELLWYLAQDHPCLGDEQLWFKMDLLGASLGEC